MTSPVEQASMPTWPRRTWEHPRVRVGLEREPQPMAEAGAVECCCEPVGVLGEPRSVVDEERRPVAARQPLGVLAGDRQPAVTCLEAGAATIQVYTGLIYEGPGIVGAITSGLAASLPAGTSVLPPA